MFAGFGIGRLFLFPRVKRELAGKMITQETLKKD
jgi:hypothetical protein